MRVYPTALALLLVFTATVAAEDDPFVAGAQVVWLRWAEQNCAGKADPATISRLERLTRTEPETYAEGERAARRSITQSVAEDGTAVLCAAIRRDYGPAGRQIKDAFRPAG
ncbi:MAG: hypothetical protein RLZ98_2187 [Pseudomonadota bacterium]